MTAAISNTKMQSPPADVPDRSIMWDPSGSGLAAESASARLPLFRPRAEAGPGAGAVAGAFSGCGEYDSIPAEPGASGASAGVADRLVALPMPETAPDSRAGAGGGTAPIAGAGAGAMLALYAAQRAALYSSGV